MYQVYFILDAKNASPHRSTLNMIDSITLQNSETFDFHLNRPNLLFPSFLAIGILPAHLIQVDHPFHSQPIGSGPFAFVARPDETRLKLIRLKDQQKFELLKFRNPRSVHSSSSPVKLTWCKIIYLQS